MAKNIKQTANEKKLLDSSTLAGINVASQTNVSNVASAGHILPGGDCQVIRTNSNHTSVEWTDAKLSGAFLGEVRMLSEDISPSAMPSGWIRCDGQILSMAGSSPYALLGQKLKNKYGGDGISSFGIPDLNAVHTSGRFAPLTYIMATESCATSAPGAPVEVSGIGGGGGVPIGTIIAYGGSETSMKSLINQGWYLCDGQAIPVTGVRLKNYSDAVGNLYGVTLPDLRGYFLRGVSGSSGIDPDSAKRTPSGPNHVGSKQDDAFQGHVHHLRARSAGGLNDQFLGVTPGAIWGTGEWLTEDATEDKTHGVVRVSAETRPRNAYVYWLIKVF